MDNTFRNPQNLEKHRLLKHLSLTMLVVLAKANSEKVRNAAMDDL